MHWSKQQRASGELEILADERSHTERELDEIDIIGPQLVDEGLPWLHHGLGRHLDVDVPPQARQKQGYGRRL